MRRAAGRMVGRIPVVPGNARPMATVASCTACGYGDRNGVLRVRALVAGIEMMLCLDYIACCERYRGAAASPAAYGAMLRNGRAG